jgi:CHAD domain-containing protein/transposase
MGTLLSTKLRKQLQDTASRPEESTDRRWAQALLLYDDGLLTHQVAAQVGLSRSRTRYIKQKFLEQGWGGPAPEPEAADSLTSEPQEKQETSSSKKPSTHPGDVKVKELAGQSSLASGHTIELVKQLLGRLEPHFQASPSERAILMAATRLRSLESKPKASAQAILAQPLAGLSAEEQQLVADLVRYQNEGKGDPKLHPLPGAENGGQRALQLLAILRMAIALDSSATQSVQIEDLALDESGMRLQVSGAASLADATAAQSTAAFWSHVFGHQVHVYTSAPINLEEVQATASTLTGPGLHPDDVMPEAGRKILRFHFLQMLLHEPGTRLGEDIEELHDMRVATRRMRAAFEVFGEYFEGKQIKSIRKGLRNTGRALGAVRDMDVIFEKADHYLESLDEGQRSGITPLLDLWSAGHVSAREKMLVYLDSPAYQNFVFDMNEFVNSPGLGAVPFQMNNPQPHRVREVAPIMIYTRLGAVRAFEQVLGNATFEQLHELRIRFKYLRYTVEFFREVLGGEAKMVIEHIKSVQDHLGDLNDANVACLMLQSYLEDWEARQVRLSLEDRQNPEPVVNYLAYRAAERHRLLVSFPEIWKNFNDPGVLSATAAAVGGL